MGEIKVDYINHMGDDLTVVNAARVSFDKKSEWEWHNFEEENEAETFIKENGGEIDWGYVYSDHWFGGFPVKVLSNKDKRLINYLTKHGHYSPFGHCFLSFRVTAPVFVARQLVKHEYLRMNEVSRRYVDSTPEFYTPDSWRTRAANKKQGSAEDLDEYTQEELNCNRDWFLETAILEYERKLSMGVAPEQARMDLPQSMMTSWYWSGSLDAFANMYNLRIKEDTQYETRLVAKSIGNIIQTYFPTSWKALTNV